MHPIPLISWYMRKNFFSFLSVYREDVKGARLSTVVLGFKDPVIVSKVRNQLRFLDSGMLVVLYGPDTFRHWVYIFFTSLGSDLYWWWFFLVQKKHLRKHYFRFILAPNKFFAAQEGCEGITVDDLKDQLQRHEGLLENLTISIGTAHSHQLYRHLPPSPSI